MSEHVEERLLAQLEFMTARSASWKALAKNAQKWYLWSLANPGLALAKMVVKFNTTPPPNDVAALLGAHACECLGWAFLEYLQQHPEAPNYLEVTLLGEQNEPMYVTVQRPGGKTPHQIRVEAETERDRLRSELESLKATGPCRS